MKSIRLIVWKSSEAEKPITRLQAAGYRVEFEAIRPDTLCKIRESPPAAIIIDLSRLPAQGRDVGIALRRAKSTRRVPIVFAGGISEKITRVREHLPDAVYSAWDGIEEALEHAIANPPRNPAVPDSALAGYARTPLVKKLGIKPRMTLAVIDAPEDFVKKIGTLPEGVVLIDDAGIPADLTIWFHRSRDGLEGKIKSMSAAARHGPLWIAWPKKSSPIAADFTQQDVRRIGLANGLVDYKVCSIDESWSGLLFTPKKAERG